MIFKMKMEFLTPCFLAGADPDNQSEFRLGALKNLLRYWWRQFQDQSNTPNMFHRESRIFGSTENRARFSLYELDSSQIIFDCSGNAYNPSKGSGRSYLFYSCIGRGKRQPGRKRWITESSKVSFAMHFAGAEDDQIKETLLSLWLLQTFGGLGSRSRRGAGSFQIEVTDCSEGMKESVQKLFDSTAEDMVRAIQGKGNEWSNPIHKASPIYKVLTTPGRFRRFGPKASAVDVLDELGKAMKDLRSCFDYNRGKPTPLKIQVAALHKSGSSGTPYSGPDPIEKTAFGLPIICIFKQRKDGRLVLNNRGYPKLENWQIMLKPDSHERRASPLFISVKRDRSNHQYYANLLILWEEFLPPGKKIAIIKKQRGINDKPLGDVRIPTSAALESFLRSLP